MAPPQARLARRALAPTALAASSLVLFGCGPGHGDPPVTETGGAMLSAAKTEAHAGETVRFDAVGSQLADSAGTCPQRLFFFVDDADRADAEAEPLTLAADGSCKVTSGAADMVLPAGQPGTTRDQKVSVMVEGTNQDGELFKSEADVVVKVHTAAATTPSTPTTAPTSPAPDPHAPGDHHGEARCAYNDDPSAPAPQFVVNPMPPVVGHELAVDATPSTDDGHIAEYAFDWGNDGSWDATSASPVARHTPTQAGEFGFCVRVTDDTGKVNHHAGVVPVEAGSSVIAHPFHVSPSDAKVYVSPHDVTEAESFAMDPHDGTSPSYAGRVGGYPPYFEHTYSSWGLKEISVTYYDEDTSPATGSTWTQFVDLTAPAGRSLARASAKKRRKKAKTYTISALLDQTQDKVLEEGRRTYADGVLSVDGVVIASRSTGRLDAKQAKALPKRLRKGMRSLYNADFVARFTGRRVVLTPDAWGLAGQATLLAQSRKGKRRSRICMTVDTDGATLLGTTFKVRGATGPAAGLSATGLYPPPVLGPRTGVKPSGIAVVKQGRKKGISKCKSLVKYLPKAKKGAKRKKRR